MRQIRQKVNSTQANLVLSGHLSDFTCDAARREEGVSPQPPGPAHGNCARLALRELASRAAEPAGYRPDAGLHLLHSARPSLHTLRVPRGWHCLFLWNRFLFSDLMLFFPDYKISFLTPASVAQWMEHCPVTKRLWV